MDLMKASVQMIKVLLCDSHSFVRQRIKHIIEGTQDIIVADEANNGDEVLAKALEDHFDIVLLDISIGEIRGLDVLQRLKAEKPRLPVLMISLYKEKEYVSCAFKRGALGYLAKNNLSKELVAAIRMVMQGKKYISSELAQN